MPIEKDKMALWETTAAQTKTVLKRYYYYYHGHYFLPAETKQQLFLHCNLSLGIR